MRISSSGSRSTAPSASGSAAVAARSRSWSSAALRRAWTTLLSFWFLRSAALHCLIVAFRSCIFAVLDFRTRTFSWQRCACSAAAPSRSATSALFWRRSRVSARRIVARSVSSPAPDAAGAVASEIAALAATSSAFGPSCAMPNALARCASDPARRAARRVAKAVGGASHESRASSSWKAVPTGRCVTGAGGLTATWSRGLAQGAP
mmetsp:Transcript_17970/g.62157  ORF Transcript_17970/g.62157 Transcript_17970/m.62157 type:complete len:206 (-) Transcript_17970:3194-3811(-)